MSNNLRLMVLLSSFLIFFCAFVLLKRGRIPLKFSLLWFLSAFIIFLVGAFPVFIMKFTNLFGFQTIANMISGLLIIILFFITICLTIIISGQNTKIQLLIQEVSLLKQNNEEDKR